MLTDFLREKKFAGDFRPVVTVENVEIKEKVIDVIVIHNSLNTPFYLKEKFKKVNANNIYIRLRDSNTPINKSADMFQIEQLWKKRFGMLSSPIEKVNYYLGRKEEWKTSPSDDTVSIDYYKFYPEYTITHSIDSELSGLRHYFFGFHDITPHWGNIDIFYHQTLLAHFQAILVDGGMYFCPSPDIEYIKIDNDCEIELDYFIEGTLKHKVLEYYYDETNLEEVYCREKLFKCFCLFTSVAEKDLFITFIKSRWKERKEYLIDLHIPHFEEIDGYNIERIKQDYEDSRYLHELLNEFRIPQFMKS